MSVTQISPAIFGQITLDDMRKNELLIKTVLPMVKQVCEHSKGRFTVENVADGLVSGSMQLWGVMCAPALLKAVLVTRKQNDLFEILIVGPDVRDTVQFLPSLEQVARRLGCRRMLMVGPKVWRETLPSVWARTAAVYELKLDGADQV